MCPLPAKLEIRNGTESVRVRSTQSLTTTNYAMLQTQTTFHTYTYMFYFLFIMYI